MATNVHTTVPDIAGTKFNMPMLCMTCKQNDIEAWDDSLYCCQYLAKLPVTGEFDCPYYKQR